ncbi:MAG: flagellar motor switch protein FliG [Spirochaetales bacterium]|nr:flagellar motor switch protein FliG [Spirochaetales bacterium]
MARTNDGLKAYQASMKKKSASGNSSTDTVRSVADDGFIKETRMRPPSSGKNRKAGMTSPQPIPAESTPKPQSPPVKNRNSGSTPYPDRSDKVDFSKKGNAGHRKAAGLLLMVGKERAAEILKHLEPSEVEGIVHEIALLNMDSDEASSILSEFHEVSQTGPQMIGGVGTAHQMLLDAFGDAEGERMYKKFLPFNGETPFGFLNDLEYTQIWNLLKAESPRVISLVLSGINPKKASLIMEELNPADRLEVIKRMARKSDIHPDVVNLMGEKFREKIRAQGKVVTQEMDGAAALAGILRYMEPGKEEAILNELTDENPELSDSIRERIFTIQDVLRIPDSDFQTVLRDYDDRELAVLIKGKRPMVREKFLNNLSERRRDRIASESEYLGPMPRKEVSQATRDFLHYLRSMEEEGSLVIPRSEEEWI